MRKDIATEWVERLRSGDINQLNGYLGNVEGDRCCLGVLCDIAVENNVIPDAQYEDGLLVYAGERSVLPIEVMEWVGAESGSNCTFYADNGEDGAVQYTLSWMNDSGESFEEIADAIEKHSDLI